jgi:hypothetical protein
MATEKAEPQTGLILKVGAFAVFTLLVAHAGLVAYFDSIAKAEEQRKFGDAKPVALMSLRADEQQRLNAGPMPIEKAMQQMVAQGRMGMSPMVVPSNSRDVAPLQGWSKMPSEAPSAMMATPEAPPSAMPVVDAGPASASDAAAPRAGRPDAAAPKAPDHGPPKHP